ncbi:MAG: glycerophosphodiester phosphodiesterase, partial [Candidatus Binatia bacterium]
WQMGLFQQDEPMINFIKVAHRGASGSCPENTRLAFEKALEARADMIEMDCQLSQDGQVVVIHDERLDRTARVKGWVKGKTLRQLKKLDVGAWFKKSFRGERILTLEEAMEIVAGRADVVIDIKQVAKGPLGIELKILFILSAYSYLGRAVISSSDYRTLRRVRELAPRAQIGIIYGPSTRDNALLAVKELKAHSIHIEKSLATPTLLEQASRLGLTTFVWTVNEVTEMQKFLSLGIDGIISDYPEKFWKIRLKKK